MGEILEVRLRLIACAGGRRRLLGDVFKLEGNRRERWMYERGDDTAYIE